MRAYVLGWSAGGGAVLGLLAGLGLLTAGVLAHAALPAGAARAVERWRGAGLVVCLVVLPLLGAAAGYLEGRLKLR